MFKILLFIILLIPIQNTVLSIVYYVSSSGGENYYDGLNGTYDGTHGPWKSISKINGTNFSPGDSVLFKKGDTWNEQLVVSSSGSSGLYIHYGVYGTGDKPIINCADTITGWNVYNENIWSASLGNRISLVSQIFMDGERQIVSRWPNRGWNTIDATSATGYYIYDTNLTQSDNFWIGTTAQIRDCDWAIESRTITSSSR